MVYESMASSTGVTCPTFTSEGRIIQYDAIVSDYDSVEIHGDHQCEF